MRFGSALETYGFSFVDANGEERMYVFLEEDNDGHWHAVMPFNEAAHSRYTDTVSLIGAKTTFFSDAAHQANRNTNIRMAAERINEQIVMPGEIFSINTALGNVHASTGWRFAPGFASGRTVQSIGGGICQVSSTLYVAVLLAELEIINRRNHSMTVDYLPRAWDAAIVTTGNALDFRFRNNTDMPITIKATTTATSLTVNIYGLETRPENRTTRLQEYRISTTRPGPTVYIEDPNLPYGTRNTTRQARTGLTYRLYMYVYYDGVQAGRTFINTSVYLMFAAEVRIGTGGAPQPTPQQEYVPQPPSQQYTPPPYEPAPPQYTPPPYEPAPPQYTPYQYTPQPPTQEYEPTPPEPHQPEAQQPDLPIDDDSEDFS